jgi:F1F0 ATPase subunit 2
MNAFDVALAFVAGSAASAVYFAALWLSVRWFTGGRLALTWLLGSAVIRLALLTGFFFWIMGGHLDRLLAALAGFLLVRYAVTWPIRAGIRGQHTKGRGTAGTTAEATNATDAR